MSFIASKKKTTTRNPVSTDRITVTITHSTTLLQTANAGNLLRLSKFNVSHIAYAA